MDRTFLIFAGSDLIGGNIFQFIFLSKRSSVWFYWTDTFLVIYSLSAKALTSGSRPNHYKLFLNTHMKSKMSETMALAYTLFGNSATFQISSGTHIHGPSLIMLEKCSAPYTVPKNYVTLPAMLSVFIQVRSDQKWSLAIIVKACNPTLLHRLNVFYNANFRSKFRIKEKLWSCRFIDHLID